MRLQKRWRLGKEIYPADIFTGFNTAQDAPVHVQLLCKPFLCIAVLLADLADTRSALFLVIKHFLISNLKFWGICDSRLGIMDILLYTGSSGRRVDGEHCHIVSKRKNQRPPYRRPPAVEIDWFVIASVLASVSPIWETAVIAANSSFPFFYTKGIIQMDSDKTLTLADLTLTFC